VAINLITTLSSDTVKTLPQTLSLAAALRSRILNPVPILR